MKKQNGFGDVITIAVITVVALVALAFGGGCLGLGRTKNEVSKFEKSVKQSAVDYRDGLLEKMDLKYEKVNPVYPKEEQTGVSVPPLVWKYGGEYRFQKCTEVWWGTMRATANRVDLDYTGVPEWYRASGSTTPCIVCAFYDHWDGTFVGGKFDWVGYSRTSRDLDHITVGKYNGWDNQYPGKAPSYVVVFDYGTNAGRWLIFRQL